MMRSRSIRTGISSTRMPSQHEPNTGAAVPMSILSQHVQETNGALRATSANSDEIGQTPSDTQGNQQYYPDSNQAKPFVCNVCKRSYSRVDHLARHYRAHTREKPFSCQICGKGFARGDLLKRHMTNHSSSEREGSSQLNYAPTGSRVAQACTACAAAKLKCGHDKPCKRCQQKRIVCTFPDEGRHITQRISEQRNLQSNISHNNVVDDEILEMSTAQIVDTLVNANQLSESQNTESIEQAGTPLVYSHASSGPSGSLDDTMQDFGDSSLANFLQEIMMSPSTLIPTVTIPHSGADLWPQLESSRDVFNFGIDNSLDLEEMDFSWMSSTNDRDFIPGFDTSAFPAEPNMESGQRTPDVSPGLTLGAEAFQRSLWRFLPAQQDHGAAEEANLSLPYKHTEPPDSRFATDLSAYRLEQDSRDKILGMLFSVCSSTNFARNVSSFPSVGALENLMHAYLRTQLLDTESWIHIPTFRPGTQIAELNSIVIAAGAVLSPSPIIRKLGYAIQEAVRIAVPKRFEEDNRSTRELQVLQSYAIQLNIGLWSGNRRKMEIAESHAQPLITMLRRAGHYRRSRQRVLTPKTTDDGETLESKWRAWVEVESFKRFLDDPRDCTFAYPCGRVSFHTLIHDAQASMALLVRPLISYTEVSLELPCSQALWMAQNAHAWRDIYLKNPTPFNSRLPSLVNCVHDMTPLITAQGGIDMQLSASIILHAMWSLVAEYRQLENVVKMQSADHRFNGGLISRSWHQELNQLLDGFRDTVSEWDGALSVHTTIMLELYMMNMYVSFEELQLFAGKEGIEEAQRVYPMLKLWVESRKSRQAVWHAGQIIRVAVSCEPQRLREFYAVALYHASLTLWAYGMVSIGTSRTARSLNRSLHLVPVDEIVWLDSDDPAAARRFISIKRGLPAIHKFPPGNEGNSEYTSLDHPKAIMDTAINILGRESMGDSDVLPPLIENLSQLIRDLGNAARAIGQR